MEDDITTEGQADESQLNPAAPEVTVENESKPEDLTLVELNALLGKDFKDKTTALKSVKDTFSYVGKRKEDIAKELGSFSESTSKELKEIKENLFYKDNPELTPYRAAISKMGSNPEEVVNTPEFKSIFDKAKGFDSDQKLKTVLSSNSRIGVAKDNLSKAREAGNNGNLEERDRLATQAVLDSLQ